MNKRVYQSLGNGYAAPLPKAYDTKTGQVFNSPLDSNSQMMSEQALLQAGHIVYPPVMRNVQGNNQYAVVDTEGAGGSQNQARVEYADVSTISGSEALNVTIDNRSKTAAQVVAETGVAGSTAYTAVSQKIVIFDGSGLIKRFYAQNPSTPVPAGVFIRGDFDKQTLLQFAQTSQSIPTDIHTLTLKINDANLFNQVLFEVVEAKINGSSPTSKKIDLASLESAGDFNNTIRTLSNFRFQANAISAIVITVPAEATISLTMPIHALGKAFNMMK